MLTLTRCSTALLILLPTFMPVARADGQVIRPGSIPRSAASRPALWTSLSVGISQVEPIVDHATASTWDFGSIIAWRASVERSLQRGASVGVVGTISRSGLVYRGEGSCLQCEADANVFQILGLYRGGGGPGLHQVLELQAGVTGFSNFRERDQQERLEPRSTVWDPTLALGYGFGYGFSTTTQLALVQDYGLLLHRTENAPANASRTRQWWTTRVGIRYAF